jgi:DNA-binding beta-propeller fold protein YncE
VSVLLLSLLACNLFGAARPEPTPLPEPSTATVPPEPVALDLCLLATAEEVSAAAGAPFTLVPGLTTGACSFSATQGTIPMAVAISAAQGEQAKTLVQQAASVALLFGQDPTALAIAQELQANAASLPLAAVVDKTDAILGSVGYTFSPATLADAQASWGWNAYGAGVLEALIGDTLVSISATGMDEDEARRVAEALFGVVQPRLPPAFTIELTEGLQVEYTSVTSTPEPTPSPVPAAMANTLWVADRLGGRVARIDAQSGAVLADIGVGRFPSSIAVGEGAVWVANEGEGTLSRIDPATNLVAATYPIAEKNFLRITTHDGQVWAAACLDDAVRAIDPASGAITGEVAIDECWNIASGGGSIWVPVGERTIVRVDPKLLIAIPTVFVRSGPAEIVEGFGSMWVTNVNARSISRFDPITREVTANIETGLDRIHGSLRGMAAGVDRMWLATNQGVLGIDPQTDQVAVTLHQAGEAKDLAEAGGRLWVTTGDAGTIVALDPITGDLVQTVYWGSQPLAIAAGP